MKELTEREVLKGKEYSEIQRHEYRRLHFFTAIYTQMNHVVLESIHKELFDILNVSVYPWIYDNTKLWEDSGHTWARNMPLERQRARLIENAHSDIDYLLSGNVLKDLEKEYLSTKAILEKQLNDLKELQKET